MNSTIRLNDDRAIEARLAARLAGALTARTDTLAHDVAERLRFARERAVARARERRLAAPAAVAGASLVAVSARGAALLGDNVPWWQRAASMLPLLLLLAGFVMIDQWSTREQVLAAAEIDSQLLADDLPPAAYSDPGFAEYLRSSPEP